jgi:hypothetical protein
MAEQNDHDILIELRTMVGLLMQNQERYFSEQKELTKRLTEVETMQGVQETKIENFKDDLRALQKKSMIFDGLNALGIAISTVLAYILGNR